MLKTCAQRDIKLVSFFPSVTAVPKVTTDNFLRQAAMDIVTILTDSPKDNLPPFEVGDDTRNALLKIAKTLHRAEQLPKHIPSAMDNIDTLLTPSPKVQNKKQSSPSKTITKQVPSLRVQNKTHPSILNPDDKQLTIKDCTWIPSEDVHQQVRYQLRPRKRHTQGTNFKDFATQQILAQHLYSHQHIHHIYNERGEKQSLDKLLKGEHGFT